MTRKKNVVSFAALPPKLLVDTTVEAPLCHQHQGMDTNHIQNKDITSTGRDGNQPMVRVVRWYEEII